jgi:hypothetical protein
MPLNSYKVGTPDYLLATAMGTTKDSSLGAFSASNLDIDAASSPEDLIPLGGSYAFLPTATSLEILSNSVEDTAAGTGARTVMIVGLDSRLMQVVQVVTLNGLTPVAIPTQLWRVNAMRLVASGSASVNVGDVVVRTVAGAQLVSMMPIGYGRSQVGVYTLPATVQGMLLDAVLSMTVVGGNENLTFRILTRAYGESWFSRMVGSASFGAPTMVIQPRISGFMSPGTDIRIECLTTSANNVQAHATVSVLQVNAETRLRP